MRLIPVKRVRSNTVLGKTIYDWEGKVLLRAGVVLRENTIKKIEELNISSIYIVDKYSREEIEDVIKPEIRQKTIGLVKEAFSTIQRLEPKNRIKNSENDYTWQEESYFYNIGKMVENIMTDILRKDDILLALVDIRSSDNYIYAHSVNVAVISLMIGIAFKLPKKKLEALCTGALLHDIGKAYLPSEIINKKEKLTEAQQYIMNTHPRIGYKYLSGTYNVSALSKIIVLQHHERVDGKGFPDGLTKDKIMDLSAIVSIADAYDNLSNNINGREAMFPSDILEYLMSNAGTMFDYNIVSVFCRIVIPFPKGTLVELSTGEIAVVEKTIPNFPLRPMVKIINSKRVERENMIIDLITELSVVITKIVYDIDF
ncbi:MAG: HD-GYP domain-containing protein [Clostridium butyricum]|nr:HD-GYP domain-containing protein [Clostridium butyricum]